MINISIEGIEQVQRQYAALGRDLNKAIAAGINKTAERVIEAEKTAMRDNLDRPTPFTLNSMASLKANGLHRNPAALVFVKPKAAAYLQLPIFGGVYGDKPDTPKGGLHPSKIRKNRFGNIPRKKDALEGIIKGERQFIGTIKTRSGQQLYGLFERPKYRPKPKPWRRRRPALVRPSKPIKVLIYAAKSGRVAIMPYYRTAARAVEANLAIDVREEVLRLLREHGHPIA